MTAQRSADQFTQDLHVLDPFDVRPGGGSCQQAAHPGAPERLDLLGHLRLGPDQHRRVDQLLRDRGGGLGLLAVEVQVLDERGLVGVAVPDDEAVVEVLSARAMPPMYSA